MDKTALWLLGALATVIVTLIGYTWRSLVMRVNALHTCVDTRLGTLHESLDDFKATVASHDVVAAERFGRTDQAHTALRALLDYEIDERHRMHDETMRNMQAVMGRVDHVVDIVTKG